MATESALDGSGPPGTAGVFDLLSNETRVRIVRELHRHARRSPDAPCLTFSALRAEVGAGDSGRFNYHLGRLRGVLVEKREAGYALSPLGTRLARLVADEGATPARG